MKPIAAFFALALAGLLGLALAAAILNAPPAYDPVDYYRQEAEIARLEAEAARHMAAARRDAALQPLDLALAGFWRVLPLMAAAGFLFTLGAWGSLALIRFHQERTPNDAGLLPVLAADQHTARAALAGFHAARLEEARRPNVPHSLNYHAPHYRGDALGNVVAPAALAAPELPTFAQLLDVGRIGKGQPLCLGLDVSTGEGVWGDWRDLYSAGVGGKQGSGKSWTATSLIAQSMLGGARVILCDPHAGDDESLLTRLGPLVPYVELTADDPGPILEAARYAHDEFERRKAAAKAGKAHDRTPLIIVIDEWTSLLRGELSDKLPPLLSSLSTEGRKYGVNALLLAQRWEASTAGGSDVRNTLTAHYVHRCRGDEGRMQTGMRAGSWPGDPIALEPGQAFLFSTRGEVRKIVTPRMTPADLGRVAQLLGGASGPASGPRPLGFHARAAEAPAAASRPGPGPDSGPARASAPESATAALDAEALRLLARFAAGATVHDLAAELAGNANPGSRKYKAARERVEALLRALAGQGVNRG